MSLILPWQAHVPEPGSPSCLEGKRVMLDVCTLLRAILFKESHSARLLEHIERAPHSVAVVGQAEREFDAATNVGRICGMLEAAARGGKREAGG